MTFAKPLVQRGRRMAVLRGLNGPDSKLAAFRGKPQVINVWASWCPPYIAEMGTLELENMLGADHLPLTLLVDAQGRVLSKTVGTREWDSAQLQTMMRSAFRLK